MFGVLSKSLKLRQKQRTLFIRSVLWLFIGRYFTLYLFFLLLGFHCCFFLFLQEFCPFHVLLCFLFLPQFLFFLPVLFGLLLLLPVWRLHLIPNGVGSVQWKQ